MTSTTQKNKIDGVILLDKATGASSNRALQQVKHLLRAQKAGHTGSLDPLASGVLPLCLGEASKFARFLLDADKTYLVSAKLGVCTDSGDSTGNITAENPVPAFTQEDILDKIKNFIGAGKQVPSMYSALKHNGQPLYKYARQNIEIERKARDIFVYSYELLDFDGANITCSIKCSKGTYIRTLIEDLGQVLGCGAHVTMLRRTQAGPFAIAQTVTLEQLQESSDPMSFVLPATSLLDGLPQITLSPQHSFAIRNGQQITLEPTVAGIICLFSSENTLLGIGQAQNDGNITALRLVAAPSPVV